MQFIMGSFLNGLATSLQVKFNIFLNYVPAPVWINFLNCFMVAYSSPLNAFISSAAVILMYLCWCGGSLVYKNCASGLPKEFHRITEWFGSEKNEILSHFTPSMGRGTFCLTKLFRAPPSLALSSCFPLSAPLNCYAKSLKMSSPY